MNPQNEKRGLDLVARWGAVRSTRGDKFRGHVGKVTWGQGARVKLARGQGDMGTW